MPTTYKIPELTDFGWQQPVINKTTNTPPSANKGDRYIIGSSPTGTWASYALYIATYNGSSWEFTAPTTGMICYIVAESLYYFYNGSSWLVSSSFTVDGFTIISNAGIISVASRIEENIALLAFYRTVDNTKSKYDLVDGFIDGFVDQTGVDTTNSINQTYVSSGTYYIPTSGNGTVSAYAANENNDSSVGNIFDSNTTTYWAATSTVSVGDPNWVSADLGSSKTVLNIQVNAQAGGANGVRLKDFNLQYSDNNTDWTTQQSFQHTNSDGTETFVISSPTSHRYWRLLMTSQWNTDGSYNRVYEWILAVEPQNMTLFSNITTAVAEPNTIRCIILEEDIDSPTINIDILAYVSIDNGVNYDQITLSNEGSWSANAKILSGIVDVSARSGTSIKWKIITANHKSFKIHGISLLWS
jgi:hypothetical protein